MELALLRAEFFLLAVSGQPWQSQEGAEYKTFLYCNNDNKKWSNTERK